MPVLRVPPLSFLSPDVGGGHGLSLLWVVRESERERERERENESDGEREREKEIDYRGLRRGQVSV